MKKNFLLATIAALTVATASAAAPALPATGNASTFINNYNTRVRLQKLVGINTYNQIHKNFQVVSTLQNNEDNFGVDLQDAIDSLQADSVGNDGMSN